MDRDLQVMMSRVARLGEMSEAEARRIVNDVYNDGIVSRGEAEALFRLNDALTKSDPLWNDRFREAIKDFLLTQEAPQSWITEEEAAWLLAQINAKDAASLAEIDLVLHVLRYAEGAPETLSAFVLGALATHIRADGVISREMTQRLRLAIYASASASASWVSRAEASALFEINDAVAFARNDPAWNDLFARAVGNHLMARAHPNPQSQQEALRRELWLKSNRPDTFGMLGRIGGSFLSADWFANVTHDAKKAARARAAAEDIARRGAADVTPEENGWLLKRLRWDEKISPAERALIDFLKAEAPGFAQGLAIAA